MTQVGEGLVSNATVSYDGLVIENIVRSSVNTRPVYNTQNTVVKYVEHTIEIEAFVYSNETSGNCEITTDGNLERIRRTLTQSGKEFIYKDKGFGSDFTITWVGGANTKRDPTYGPRPRLLLFEPMAGHKVARIVWVCEVRTVECFDGNFEGVSEFWCTSSLKINRSGYQTLTRRGYLEIMAGTTDDKLGTQLSNEFQPYIETLESLAGMPAYHVEHDFNFAPDDRSCTFTITYTEIESPNAYPMGVVNIEFSHEQQSKLLGKDKYQAKFKTWLNTFNCNIKLRPKTPKTRAWEIFSVLAIERISDNVIEVPRLDNEGEVQLLIKVPVILSIRVAEDVFADTASFTVVWSSNTPDSIGEAFKLSGMFSPVEGTDWDLWQADLRLIAQNPYGAYPIENLGNTTAIVSPCNQDIFESAPGIVPDNEEYNAIPLFQPKCPPEEASWVEYQNKFTVEFVTSTLLHTRYLETEDIDRSSYDPEVRKEEFELDTRLNTKVNLTNYIKQDYGNDTFRIRMQGFAVRLGRPTKPPQMLEIGGKEVALVDDRNFVTNRVLDSYGECPTYITTWDITYEVLGYPSDNLEPNRETTGNPHEYQ